jgi:DNA-directed RNA polymerase specialized sigma24 family protein
MNHRRILIQAAGVLVLVWAVVFVVRAAAGSQRVTAEKIDQAVAAAGLEDWSGGIPAGAELREDRVREIAGMFNQLDFAEREKARDLRLGERVYRPLAPDERRLFIDLTVEESMKSLMRALDAMNPEERRKIVERGLNEIATGRTAEEMQRAEEMGEELLARITEEGVEAYFEQTGPDTKLDLAPLMDAMDGVLKGLRGSEFAPPEL